MHKLLTYFVLILISISFGEMVYADNISDMETSFKKGLQYANSAKSKPIIALQTFKPEAVFKSYSTEPAEVSYNSHPEDIKLTAKQDLSKNQYGKLIKGSIDSRREKFNFTKDPSSPIFKEIYKKSDNIYEAMTGQFSDCTKKSTCVTTYKKESCEESPINMLQYCTQKLDIDMAQKQIDVHYPLTIHISTKEHYYAGATINPVTGNIDSSGPHDSTFNLDGRLPAQLDCQSLQGRITAIYPQNSDTEIDTLVYPSCGNDLKLNIHVTNKNKKRKVNLAVQLDITSAQIIQEPQERWIDGCTGLANTTSCILKADRCLESNTTHEIEGMKIEKPCWQKEVTYQCSNPNITESCLPLREQGCEQVGSACKHKDNGNCTYYEQTFQCPIRQCTDVGMICKGETYCLEGDCVKEQRQADPDFQKSVSALSATHEAAKSFTNINSIFSGQRKTCDKVFLSFIDCCSDDGWGKDARLVQCSPEEKDLEIDKENLQTVYLGEYCKKNELGACVEQRKAYCVFPSKLARIIQVQGRKQLGISFGEPDNADCRGLTREEFSTLNLEIMDFSDFYVEIAKKQKIEEPDSISKRVTDKKIAWESEGKFHD